MLSIVLTIVPFANGVNFAFVPCDCFCGLRLYKLVLKTVKHTLLQRRIELPNDFYALFI